jgi:hypothetical protein
MCQHSGVLSSWLPRARRVAGPRPGPGLRYALVAVVIVAAGCFTFWYRATYGVLPGQGDPARVHWCGRDYQDGGGPALTWRQVLAGQPSRVHAVGRYPPLGWPGQELFAAATRPAPRSTAGPPLACAVVVYLRTGPGNYRAYSLEGGP